MLPLIHRLQLIPTSLPFYLESPDSPWRGRKQGNGEGDRQHGAGEDSNLRQKFKIYWEWEWERWRHGQGLSHTAPPPAHPGGRKALTIIEASVCPTRRLSPFTPTWPISYLSGPSFSPRLCLELRWSTQPSSPYAQVSVSSSKKSQPLVWQMRLEWVMRKCYGSWAEKLTHLRTNALQLEPLN